MFSAICESASTQPRQHALRRRIAIGKYVGQGQRLRFLRCIAQPAEKCGIGVQHLVRMRIDDDDAVVGLVDERLVARVGGFLTLRKAPERRQSRDGGGRHQHRQCGKYIHQPNATARQRARRRRRRAGLRHPDRPAAHRASRLRELQPQILLLERRGALPPVTLTGDGHDEQHHGRQTAGRPPRRSMRQPGVNPFARRR